MWTFGTFRRNGTLVQQALTSLVPGDEAAHFTHANADNSTFVWHEHEKKCPWFYPAIMRSHGFFCGTTFRSESGVSFTRSRKSLPTLVASLIGA
jgi:hypothetical protein